MSCLRQGDQNSAVDYQKDQILNDRACPSQCKISMQVCTWTNETDESLPIEGYLLRRQEVKHRCGADNVAHNCCTVIHPS